jgi:hypothetical protein
MVGKITLDPKTADVTSAAKRTLTSYSCYPELIILTKSKIHDIPHV